MGERIYFIQDIPVAWDQALTRFIFGLLLDELVLLVVDAGLLYPDGAVADVNPAQTEDLGAAQRQPRSQQAGTLYLSADLGEGKDQAPEICRAVHGRLLLRLLRREHETIDLDAGRRLDQAPGGPDRFSGVVILLGIDRCLNPGAGQVLDSQRHELLQVVPGLPFVSVDCRGGGDALPGLDILCDEILHKAVVRLLCFQQAGLCRPGFRIIIRLGLSGDRDALALDHKLSEPGAGLQTAGCRDADLCLVLQLLLAAPVAEDGVVRDVSSAVFTFHEITPRKGKYFTKKGKKVLTTYDILSLSVHWREYCMDNAFRTIAYHKNDAGTAQKNVMLQTFYISHDKPDKEMWLGTGIYFWEKQRDAEWWQGGYQNETILEAELSCAYDQYVNLDQENEKKEFQEFCRQIKEQMGSLEGYRFDFTRGKFQVNSFFFNVFKETYDILLLKYSFPKINNRPQYCATDNRCISNIKIAARLIASEWNWC